MFFRKTRNHKTYDKENYKPILRISICTGETTAGFKDVHNGKFWEVMLIRNDKDLEEFKEIYDIREIEKEY